MRAANVAPEVRERVDEAIRAGGNDLAVARAHGVGRSYARTRRKALGIAPFPKGLGGSPGERRNPGPRRESALMPHLETIRRMAGDGCPDREIGEVLGCPRWKVKDFRKAQGIPAGTPTPGSRPKGPPRVRASVKSKPKPPANADNPAFRHPLYARVSKAVGNKLAPDLRDDAISDIILAVMAGELPEDQIEKRARKMVNKTLSIWGTRFGPPSLDEGRGDDRADDYNLYHLIPCGGQTAAMRVAELAMLAERMGINVAEVLDTDPEPCEPWTGRRSIRKKRRPYNTLSRESKGPDAWRLEDRIRRLKWELDRWPGLGGHRETIARLEAQLEAMPLGKYGYDAAGRWVWRAFVEHEYSLVGELNRPAYGTGQWLGEAAA